MGLRQPDRPSSGPDPEMTDEEDAMNVRALGSVYGMSELDALITLLRSAAPICPLVRQGLADALDPEIDSPVSMIVARPGRGAPMNWRKKFNELRAVLRYRELKVGRAEKFAASLAAEEFGINKTAIRDKDRSMRVAEERSAALKAKADLIAAQTGRPPWVIYDELEAADRAPGNSE